MSSPGAEKRREERRPASGVVRVRCSEPQSKEIEGRLIDVSSSGFRMAHKDSTLAAGQLVDFSHNQAAGKARVMWNRIVERAVESGFLVVGRS